MAWYTGPARAHCVFSLNEGMARSTSDVAQQDSSRAVRSPGAAVRISSVQFSRSVVSDSVIPWTAARQAALSITNSRSPPRLAPVQILALCCTCSLGLDIPCDLSGLCFLIWEMGMVIGPASKSCHVSAVMYTHCPQQL